MGKVASIPRPAATPGRELESGPAGKVFTYRRSDFLVATAGAAQPQAFLVEMPDPGAVIPPHFHREDEFQIVVAGGGSLGKHALAGTVVHFADAYTPYGPIRVGPVGLTFFTLRARADAGAQYMPESRASMLRKARRSIAAVVPPDGGTGPLWAPHDDGLAAWSVRLAPGAILAHPPGDGARYYLVLDGDLVHEDDELPCWSCVWADGHAARPRLRAADAGAHLVVAQFPRAASMPLR